MTTSWSWPSSTASRVCSMNAATSEATKCSPSPTPTTSGDDRRGGARGGAGGVRVGKDEGESAFEAAADGGDAGREVTLGVAFGVGAGDEVRGGLTVGVTGHLDAVGLQLGAQGGEVLDDAVVHDGDALRGVAVRVRVAVDRRAVGRPAGVAHAGG